MDVIAIHRIQRTNPKTGKREIVPAKAFFTSSGKELEDLMSVGAVRQARPSDKLKAEEDGVVVMERPVRQRSRREMRAIREASDFDASPRTGPKSTTRANADEAEEELGEEGAAEELDGGDADADVLDHGEGGAADTKFVKKPGSDAKKPATASKKHGGKSSRTL